MTSHPIHIVFAGGGTGGHLFPGLAVAQAVGREFPDVRVTFVGSGKPLERRHVCGAGFDYRELPCQPMPRRPWHVPGFVAKNLAGFLAARRFLRETHVGAVVGLGGYASVPVARAAKGCGARLILLEQNVVPGRATRWLARSADAVCVAFEPTVARLRCRKRVEVTGTPIRHGFTTRVQSGEQGGPRRLLILGGSGGAQSLNENVPRALYMIRRELARWEIVHQAGEAGVEATRSLYGKLGLDAMVVPFLRNMDRVLRQTDLAVCRAGGSTLAELAAVGVPAVLLPYPHAADDHQAHNAELFRTVGGCPVLDERQIEGRLDESLSGVLSGLVADGRRRERIAYTLRRLGRPDATESVSRILFDLLGISTHPAGDWSIFRREDVFGGRASTENMDLSPSTPQGGQSHFRGVGAR
ncbi:MAG: undecaprenyldiphospho-muramoylpentapeptide beta-N-acetylglucosaminyltransferase, partial [Planctomycetia bacterium]|nr:undecaprenyldiphospho-muramoylpentapeptide beta-N-acetylglucosaminyltransferase [Planctomycetia bacterium]